MSAFEKQYGVGGGATAPDMSGFEQKHNVAPLLTADKMTFLQKAGTLFSAPWYTLLNAPAEASNPGPSLATKVLKDKSLTFMQKMQKIQQGYDPFSEEQIQHAENEPGTEGQINRTILAPWKNPVIKGVNRFLVDWNNPFYKATDALQIPGMLHNAAAVHVPGYSKITRPIENAAETVTAPIARTFDRFHDYAHEFGNRAAGIVRTTIGRSKGGAEGDAFSKVMDVFSPSGAVGIMQRSYTAATSGLNKMTKWAIVLASQGRNPVEWLGEVPLPKGWTMDTLVQRGKQLRELVQKHTQDKVNAGVLDPTKGEVDDPATYFPMSNAYKRDAAAATTRAGGRGGYNTGLSITKGSAAKGKYYETLEQSLGSGNLREDWDPAVSLFEWLKKGNHDIATNAGLRQLRGENAGVADALYDYHGNTYQGAAGFDQLQKLIKGESTGAARQIAAKNTGIDASQLGRMEQLGPQVAKLSALRAGGDAVGAVANKATNATMQLQKLGNMLKHAQDPATKRSIMAQMGKLSKLALARTGAAVNATARVGEQKAGQIERMTSDTMNKIDTIKITNQQAAKYRSEFERVKDEMLKAKQGQIGTRAPEGFVIPTQRIGSGEFEHTAVAKSLYDIFTTAGAKPEQAKGIAVLFDTLNKWARVQIIANPTVHGVFNLGTHFLGSGGNPEFFIDGIWHNPDPALAHEAEQHGATVGMGPQTMGIARGGSASTPSDLEQQSMAHLMTSEFGGLSASQKIDKVGSAGWEANQQVVFEGFEKRYATELYRMFTRDQHMDPFEAGTKVRQALGDYANVGGGLDAALNRAFFFYPWMKTVVPFWVKAMGRPAGVQAALTPMDAIQGYNRDTGADPADVAGSSYRMKLGNTIYDAPLPSRVLDTIGSGDLAKVGNWFGGHLNPAIKSTFDTLYTALNKTPLDPNTDFNAVYDKLAPAKERALQALKFYGSQFAPGPAGIAKVVSGEQKGGPGALVAPAIGGFSHPVPDKMKSKMAFALRLQMEKAVGDARKMGDEKLANDMYRLYTSLIDEVNK